MARRLLVGRFGAPHGVRGEVRLQSYTGDPKAIAGYGPLAAGDGRAFTLTGVRPVKDNMLVARVAGVDGRDGAAALTGVELFLDRDALPPPDAEEFYVADLVGMAAYDRDGAALGTVVAVPNYGGGDLVEIRPVAGGETLLLPFTRAVVPTVDLAARRITVDPPADVEADDLPAEDEADDPEADDPAALR